MAIKFLADIKFILLFAETKDSKYLEHTSEMTAEYL